MSDFFRAGYTRQNILLSADTGFPDDGSYSGVFWSNDGYTISSVLYYLGVVLNGAVQFGISSSGVAGSGNQSAVIDAQGIRIYNGATEVGRFGDLNGFLGYASTIYGLALGDTNGFLKYDVTSGLRVKGTVVFSGVFPNGFDVYGERLDTSLFNGERTDFQLVGPYITGYVQIILNGVWLKSGGTDYSEVANTTFVMATAPATGDAIRCRYIKSSDYSTVNETPTGSVDGSNKTFTTANAHVAGSLMVWLNGVTHTPIDDYVNGGRSITFVSAPASTDTAQAVYLLEANSAVVWQETPSGSINGSNAVFTLANTYVAGSLIVILNGVLQTITDDYTESAATTITFGTAPKTGDQLWVTYKT